MIFSHKSGLKYRAMFPGKSSVVVVGPPSGGDPAMGGVSGGGSTGSGGSSGGSSAGGSVSEKDVNFYDYDGTLLHAYTVAEAQALTELPELPERDGLICQGWNYDLETIKEYNRAVNVGATYTTDDGTTRIYIHLEDGRTSPMLGVCPNGTVTVDWGDGTEPDVLTGTSTSTVKWTPNHEYAAPGDYVIQLTVSGKIDLYGEYNSSCLLRYASTTDSRNQIYQSALQKVEIGQNVERVNDYTFCNCFNLKSISIPKIGTTIKSYVFKNCYSLPCIIFPTSSTTHTISDYVAQNCYSLRTVIMPNVKTNIKPNAFENCCSLSSVTIPKGTYQINSYAFANCASLSSITIPGSVTYFGSGAFSKDYGIRYYDFTDFTNVHNLSTTSAFENNSEDFEIRVPAALYDEWIAATNWVKYADKIVAV